jgi:hypothetical protein
MELLPRAPNDGRTFPGASQQQVNNRTNNATFWEPFSGRVYDTQSNVNYFQGPQLRAYNDSTRTIDTIRRVIKNVYAFVLESDWRDDLFPYVVVENKKPRLVVSKEEYKEQQKNIYRDFHEKAEFIKDHFANKKQLKSDLMKLFAEMAIPNQMAEFDKVVNKYLYKRAKKRVIKAVKKAMAKK